MKKKVLCLYYIILMLICPVLTGVGKANAGVQDFYFSDFTGDYYLSKDAEGISHLKVVESMTAEFPEYKQNKGICRQVPFTNQGGVNVTLPSLTRTNIKVTRNGVTEPIYSIERENNYYDVCTGTEEYLLGTQVFTFEYEFEKVVTDFGDYQELYWDTNGNGWRQKFEKLTARVHLENPEVYTGKNWCYVGKYGGKGEGRCKVKEIGDGVEFTTEQLAVGENLTFDLELLPGSFVVPKPEDNYTYVWLMVILTVICIGCIVGAAVKFMKTREKSKYYKGLFVKPEYQPNAEYGLPEMAELYMGKKKDTKVAMLLELVVERKIELVKGEKKKWSINVKNLDGVGEEYIDLLSILNGGPRVKVGDVIEVKNRTATSRLIALRKAMEKKVEDDLETDGLATSKWRYGAKNGGVWNALLLTIIIAPMMIMLGVFVLSLLDDKLGLGGTYGGRMVFAEYFYRAAMVMIIVTVFIVVWLMGEAGKYKAYAFKGLEMARYMDGLKMYIEMAEAERMKVLQSVEGADTSAEGIVKLYEKLLPYAALFGLEESWMNEMKEYCKVEEIPEPDYLMTGIMVSDLTRGLRSAATYATTATVMSSSGGGSSSGFSGGGGGGFSGGGGGGGGGGGR